METDYQKLLNACKEYRAKVDELERENAALRAELAPLRETVGVAATASTCADDLSNWSKLVERADNSTRLERENAALKIERNRYKVALQDIASASTGWAKERAQMQLRKEAQP